MTELKEELVYKIFWPLHLCNTLTESGYLVGWNLGLAGVVVADKASYASAEQVSTYMREFHQGLRPSEPADPQRLGIRETEFWTQPVQQPHLLGYLSRESEGLCEPDVRDCSDLWISAFTARTQVAFRSISSFGQPVNARIILTLYDENLGRPWHFYSASPMSLDLNALPAETSCRDWPLSSNDLHGSSLQHVLDYINTAAQVHEYLEGGSSGTQNNPQAHTWSNCSMDGSHDNVQTVGLDPHRSPRLEQRWPPRILSRLSQCFLRVLDHSFFGTRLKETSAVGHQLNLIVRRATYLTEQWSVSHHSRRPKDGKRHNSQYMSFWNSIWVIAIDLFLGCLLGMFLVVHSQRVGDFILRNLRIYTVISLEQTIDWLRKWPAGLKLNNGLDGFLAELFLWLIHFWTIVFQPFTKCIRAIVIVAGWAGFFGGCSMQLAVLSDTLALTTLHTYWFYMVATRIFHWQLVSLYSLFNLFRGRKHNVLRNRIDSCDYGLDQLLIGTILFTLLTYLFPTVLVYYVMFVSRRLAVIMAQGLLEILLGILNHCPIFYLLLRLQDPKMFPGGVSYNINSKWARRFIEAAWRLPNTPVRLSRDPIPLAARSRMNVTVVQMDQVPAPLSAIFFQYYHIWAQFSASYLSLSLFRSMIVGDVIKPVPRLQYSMIPGVSSTTGLNRTAEPELEPEPEPNHRTSCMDKVKDE
ncbi:pig-Q [Coemansia sp. Benny D115]|nr:pig-Q [Coemansia sp. Benny D115]